MQLIPIDVDEIPAGRTGDTVTQGFLNDFLADTDDSGTPLGGAEVTLQEGEKVENVRSQLLASIDKHNFPVRVVSKTTDGNTRLFVKRDESVLPEIEKRKASRKAAAEKAKSDRKAERDAQKAANGNGEVTEAPEPVEPTPEPEPELVKSGRRGR